MSEIRSYRSVFHLERRIYRVDRLRLNPGGIPVRGVVYCLALVLALALTARLPLTGAALGVLPWYARELLLPSLAAALLTVVRLDGRPAHLAALVLLRHGARSGHLWALRPCAAPGRRWLPDALLMLPDGSDARLRRLRYTGPGAVRQPASGRTIVLERGARLDVG